MCPQHREYMHSLLSSRPFLVEQKHPEISAEEGIMTERFCIGPEEKNGGENGGWIGTTEEDAIFLHPNIWPVGADGARLRAAMTDCYARMEEISEVLLSIRPHFYFPLSSLIPRQSTRAARIARTHTHTSPLRRSCVRPTPPPHPRIPTRPISASDLYSPSRLPRAPSSCSGCWSCWPDPWACRPAFSAPTSPVTRPTCRRAWKGGCRWMEIENERARDGSMDV